jgi:hypothetical protein
MFKLMIPQQQAYFRYRMSGLPLQVICNVCPLDMDKPHIFALSAETDFLRLKDEGPLNKKKNQQSMSNEALSVDTTFDPS